MKIGFIGLGLMGFPMCANLLKKGGAPVLAYDVNCDTLLQMKELGAEIAGSNAEVGENCDIIFSMVPKNEHVKMVYEEVLPHVRPGTLLIDMSTIAPDVSRELAARAKAQHCEMIDAPVVKSRPAAIDGTLGIYVGGSEQAFQRAKPLLEHLGSNIIHIGENGAGLVMKLCHNALVAQIQNGVNETLVLAKKAAGINERTFAQAVSYGGGQNFYLDSKISAIATRDFTTAFSVANMDKDIHLAQLLCEQTGLQAAGIALACDRYEHAMQNGYASEDFSATFKLFA